MKMAKMTIYVLPTKTRGPQSQETDENDENGGCPSDKTTVCQKHCFRHPDNRFCADGNSGATGWQETPSERLPTIVTRERNDICLELDL